jgi:uncharacterized protein
MDPARGVCIGCCRTLDEIARWSGLNDAERAEVLSLLPARRASLEGKLSTIETPAR